VVILGGIVGAILGLAIVILPIEWLDPDAFSDTTETVLTVVVAAAGAFAGSQLTRRLVGQRRREWR
jgi:hypothetical protein